MDVETRSQQALRTLQQVAVQRGLALQGLAPQMVPLVSEVPVAPPRPPDVVPLFAAGPWRQRRPKQTQTRPQRQPPLPSQLPRMRRPMA